jgi:GntR family transcriptional regulator/MocR family aminotransferase
MGTFSKTVMPALRISYLVMPRSTLNAFHETGEIIESAQPVLTQKIVTSFLNEGHFFRHLKKMRTLYQQRRQRVLNALHQVFRIYSMLRSMMAACILSLFCATAPVMYLAQIWQKSS